MMRAWARRGARTGHEDVRVFFTAPAAVLLLPHALRNLAWYGSPAGSMKIEDGAPEM
jgi:hypothetical protein